MKSIHWIHVSILGLALTAAGGCALEEPPDGQPSKIIEEPAELDGAWVEVSPGVFLKDDGEVREWRIQGVEGHEAFMAEIQQRLGEAQPGEEKDFYQRVLEGVEGSIAYASQHADEIAYKGRVTEVEITDLVNGLRARAHASRGWGYVAAEVYVSVNDQTVNDRKSKSDTCISSCSVTVERQLTATFPPVSCRATAYANAGGTTQYIERNTCPITCTPRTTCSWWECGWVGNGCGGSLYCGPCPCVCGDGICDFNNGEDPYNCPADCGGSCGLYPAGTEIEICPIE